MPKEGSTHEARPETRRRRVGRPSTLKGREQVVSITLECEGLGLVLRKLFRYSTILLPS